ncbi:MAG: hypothetical protein J6C51_00525 [Clostridia bacterium]|nr:hypothetical protein [Clostridia bacterium]
MLYHGTVMPGLQYIKANSRSHTSGENVAYFTADRCYALICCRDAKNNFVTMGLRADGKQHYFERFPDQLKTLYGGKRGYLYIPDTVEGLENTKGNTWESQNDVHVSRCEVIEDVYPEILKEEARCNVVIHRYKEIDPEEQKMQENYIKAHLDAQGDLMREFFIAHFSSLWDE